MKQDIFDQLNEGHGKLLSSTVKKVGGKWKFQLDKWQLNNTVYYVTSHSTLRNDKYYPAVLKIIPYHNETLQQLTDIN